MDWPRNRAPLAAFVVSSAQKADTIRSEKTVAPRTGWGEEDEE
jgi:hypothetical protein